MAKFSNLTVASSVNAAMFAVTTDSPFKVDTHVYTAVAISSSACGLGIAFNVWFLLRYSWVDLGTFIVRLQYRSYSKHFTLILLFIAPFS